MAIYLVTGGAGFIGSHLVEKLLKDGHQVRILDDFSTGRKENLIFNPAPDNSSLRVFKGDLCDADTVGKAASGVDGIFHLGAVPSVIRSVEDPIRTTEVNVLGTLNVLMAAREAGASRVVFASSSSVYGSNADGRPLAEEDTGLPLSPYAASKSTGESYMGVFHRLYGLETVSLRYFNVFGPRQDPQGEYAAVIAKFITCALAGEPLPIYGDGQQTRDFTYVGNVVDATALAMEASTSGEDVLNVAGGSPVSLLEMVATLEQILGSKPKVVHLPARPGDIRHSSANIERSRAHLGFNPKVSFYQGLEYTVSSFRGDSQES